MGKEGYELQVLFRAEAHIMSGEVCLEPSLGSYFFLD